MFKILRRVSPYCGGERTEICSKRFANRTSPSYVQFPSDTLGKGVNLLSTKKHWVKLYHKCSNTTMDVPVHKPRRLKYHRTQKPKLIPILGIECEKNITKCVLLW